LDIIARLNKRFAFAVLLNDWLAHKLRPMFEQRVLPITEDVMLKWRLLVEEGRKIDHTFSQPDFIIAATARHYDLTIVSRDTSDFEKARVTVSIPGSRRLRPRQNCGNAGTEPLAAP
jgi:predicted nucleic acid-binding protein